MSSVRLLKHLAVVTPVLGLSFAMANCAPEVSYDYLFDAAQNNTVPVARAGADSEVPVGSQAVLDGSGSYDPDDEEISFHWRLHEKPASSELPESVEEIDSDGRYSVNGGPFSINNNRNAVVSSFTPDVEGIYTFGLVVTDGAGSISDSDFVVFTVASSLDLPVADAGPNQSTFEGSEICLDGSNSHDPAQREITFQWSLVSVPELSLAQSGDLVAADESVCFTPDAPGSYTVSLVVDNGIVESDPDFAFVAVGSTNQGPTAIVDLGDAYSCDFVSLSGASSTDPENDALNYNWDMLRAPNGSAVPLGPDAFDDYTLADPVFYADKQGTYTVQLVVNDGESYSAPVFLEFDLLENSPTNAVPEVVVTPDTYFSDTRNTCNFDAYNNCLNCPSCSNVVFDLSAAGTTDADGDEVNYHWEVVTGPGSTQLVESGVEEDDGDTDALPVEGLDVQVQVPGPPGSCTTALTTNTVQVRVSATDCDGDVGTGLFTVVYDCIAN
jgi:hypothetical protein